MQYPPPPPTFQPGPPPPQQPPQQLIRTYTSQTPIGRTTDKLFEEDAEKLFKEGWRIYTLSSSGQTSTGKPTTIITVYVR